MPAKLNPSVKFRCALITVSDMEPSREIYGNILGQKLRYDFGANVEFQDDLAIHFRSRFQQLIDGEKIMGRANNFELYFEHDDLEPSEDKLNNYGVKFVHKIREQPWMIWVMILYDPDDNMIEVEESLERLSCRLPLERLGMEKISATTGLTLDLVKTSIKKFKQDNRKLV